MDTRIKIRFETDFQTFSETFYETSRRLNLPRLTNPWLELLIFLFNFQYITYIWNSTWTFDFTFKSKMCSTNSPHKDYLNFSVWPNLDHNYLISCKIFCELYIESYNKILMPYEIPKEFNFPILTRPGLTPYFLT